MPETVVTQGNDSAAQAGAEGSSTTPAATAGTGTPTGATLESRIAGLEARLAEQGRSKSNAEKERDAANQRLADYEAGKLTDQEAFQAELKRERDRATAAERTARLAKIEARYPETFAVFGETAADLAEEALAAAEARFKGVETTSEPPTPRTPGAPRPAAAKPGEPREGQKPTLASLRAEFRGLRLPWADDNI